MKELAKKLKSTLDLTTLQLNEILDNFYSVVDGVDWDFYVDEFTNRKNELLAKGDDLMKEAMKLMEEAKSSITDFECEVPYNKKRGEVILYEAKDGVLTVKVSLNTENETYEYMRKMTIPKGCNPEDIKIEIDETKNVAKFTIPQKNEKLNQKCSDEQAKCKVGDEAKCCKKKDDTTYELEMDVDDSLSSRIKGNIDKAKKLFEF